jgi:hypothetical protein
MTKFNVPETEHKELFAIVQSTVSSLRLAGSLVMDPVTVIYIDRRLATSVGFSRAPRSRNCQFSGQRGSS